MGRSKLILSEADYPPGLVALVIVALKDKIKFLEEENARLKVFNEDLHKQLAVYREAARRNGLI